MKTSNSRERIKELLEIYGMNQKEFCQKTGIPRSVVSLYVNGQRDPRQDKISMIADCFNIDAAWLMGYDVPMKRANYNELLNIIDSDSQIQIGSDLTELILQSQKMSEKNLKKLLVYSQKLVELQELEDESDAD